MNRIRFSCALMVLIMFGGTILARSPQEKYMQRDMPLPDSMKHQLPATVDESRVQRNWSQLKKGMQPGKVEALLGKPTKVAVASSDNSVTWHYGKHLVIFDLTKDCVRFWYEEK